MENLQKSDECVANSKGGIMKWIIMCIILFLIISNSCTQKYNEDELKIEIKEWWESDEISEVVIDDIAAKRNKVKVLARVIIWDDTTNRLTYGFEKFEKGWRITKGPLDEIDKSKFISKIMKPKIRDLTSKMYTLQLCLEDYSTMANVKYPLDFSVRIKDLISHSANNQTVLDLLPTNYEPKPIMAIGDTSQWYPEYKEKVIYFPRVIEGKTAYSYIIRGSTAEGFIELVLTKQTF